MLTFNPNVFKMKEFLLCLSLCISVSGIYAQKQVNTWYFGNHAGVDFNTSPPTPLLNGQTNFPGLLWNEGCATISDSSGSLLFYTNGMNVWNRGQHIMPNGSGLLGHSSSTESSIIVPLPNSQQYFYVFTTDASENNFKNGLRYNVVDMCLDNDSGDVLLSAKNVLLMDTVSEKLSCVRHSNGTDYWILSHKYGTDAFCAFKLSASGISDTIISHTGTVDPQGWGGQMIVSPNGQKMAYAIPNGQSFGKTLLLDFDAATGVVSNEQTLSSGGREYGVSFSPDGSKLYFSTIGIGNLFQYDLNAGNLSAIIASKVSIIQNGPDSWRGHQLGPDGKIYVSRTNELYLSVIEFPDSSCPACGYIDSALYLGGKLTSFCLPNFITGFSYSNTVPSLCSSTKAMLLKNVEPIRVYPNPANEELAIIDNAAMYKRVEIINLLGQLVLRQDLQAIENHINVKYLGPGVYYLLLKGTDGLRAERIQKQ